MKRCWNAIKNFDYKPPGIEPHPPKYPIVGPGRAAGAQPGDPKYEYAAGVERVEYLAKLVGKSPVLNEPLNIYKRGTMEDPIPVPSVYEDRIVGCSGFPVDSHDLIWWNLKGKERCIECGQAFEIQLYDHITGEPVKKK